QDEGQTHIVFGEVAKDSTILSFYMGKAKGFLTAIQHQEILMTDLGLFTSQPLAPLVGIFFSVFS
ncbi:MAG: hypothetical protein SOX84_04020, partial [Prevotella sp.]|nr:hypothetical protein [Prevotella sp.]MDY4217931.1 hypothetical protein [Prevotella sp.]